RHVLVLRGRRDAPSAQKQGNNRRPWDESSGAFAFAARPRKQPGSEGSAQKAEAPQARSLFSVSRYSASTYGRLAEARAHGCRCAHLHAGLVGPHSNAGQRVALVARVRSEAEFVAGVDGATKLLEIGRDRNRRDRAVVEEHATGRFTDLLQVGLPAEAALAAPETGVREVNGVDGNAGALGIILRGIDIGAVLIHHRWPAVVGVDAVGDHQDEARGRLLRRPFLY